MAVVSDYFTEQQCRIHPTVGGMGYTPYAFAEHEAGDNCFEPGYLD